MKRSLAWTAVLLAGAGMGAFVPTVAAAQTYSEQFTQFQSYFVGTSQWDNWLSFRASLPASGVNSITVKGSRDPVGRTCSDPVKAQQIADAMRAGAAGLPVTTITLSLSCDGFTWNTGSCSTMPADANNLELNVGAGVSMCFCPNNFHILRPGIGNDNWGGIAGPTCNAPTQTITVVVEILLADINIKPGSDPNSINTCSGGNTPVTIWGSDQFDVTTVSARQTTLASGLVKTVGKTDRTLCSIEDVGSFDETQFDNLGFPDTIDDLTCHYVTVDLDVTDTSTTADLNIVGCDDPTVVGGMETCEPGDPGFYDFIATDAVNIVKDCL